jgi:hypothetical protein
MGAGGGWSTYGCTVEGAEDLLADGHRGSIVFAGDAYVRAYV